jgi:hypothetical protein
MRPRRRCDLRRLLAVVVVMTSLIGMVGSPAVVAQSPSPGPVGLGGRVAVPEAGFALTFPEDWVWVRHPVPDVDAAVGWLAGVAGSADADRYRDLLAMASEAAPVIGTLGFGRDTCFVQEWEWDLSLGDLAAMMQAWYQGEDAYTAVTSTAVMTRAGEAIRIDYRYSSQDASTDQAQYLYTQGQAGLVHVLNCAADDPPADRWLSIAETFEFLLEQE